MYFKQKMCGLVIMFELVDDLSSRYMVVIFL